MTVGAASWSEVRKIRHNGQHNRLKWSEDGPA